MDLRAIVNDDKGSGQKKEEGRDASATGPAPPYSNVQPSTPSQYGHPSQQNTPLYAPPSAGGIPAPPPQSQGVTALRTPSQTIGSAQYPFPTQTQQSPISAVPGQSYRPFESQPSANAARPGSHGHAYQTSQPASYTGHTPVQQQHSYASISPTPPSHLSRTPSSMRQSPMATISQLPSQQQANYSQPNTPLGPPPHLPQRAPTFPETQSPYHQRRISNASNGLISGSPAQHHPGIPHLVESPSAYARPSPRTAHSRHPSEYLSHSQRASRERSISVSPKTKPPPRPSLESRQSSNSQETYAVRAPEQYNSTPLAGAPNHVMSQYPLSLSQSQSGFAGQPNAAAGVSQATPSPLQPAPNVFASHAQNSLSSQSGNHALQPQPLNTISHQNERMGMSHLVTPASEVPPHINGHSASHQASTTRSGQHDVNFPSKIESNVSPPLQSTHPIPHTNLQRDIDTSIDQKMIDAQPNGAASVDDNGLETRASLKRPASFSIALEEPPSKHMRSAPPKRVRERPTWAQLSKFNPKFHEQISTDKTTTGHQSGHQAGPPRANGSKAANAIQHTSHHAGSNGSAPIDTDLLRVRGFLGDWERSFSSVQPLPDTKRAVADWIFTQLAPLRDVGVDPQYGTVEIEGKIGTLFHKDTGDRISLPVMNTVILNAAMSEQYRFESRMQEFEHAHMNRLLNTATQNSMKEPHRVRMDYKHFVDVDSFQLLSPTGLAALPPSIRSRVEGGRPPKLRTTVRHEKERNPYVAARIVKVNVANLQIYSPNDPYDLRISINVEVNLDRPGMNPDDLVVASSTEKDATPERRKDRVSYSHLAYQIDLTRVDVGCGFNTKTAKPVYELELEVDSVVLRRQMEIAARGEQCAFGDVVAGFWDNAVLLMRERAPAR